MKKLSTFIFVLYTALASAQQLPVNPYKKEFNEAYNTYPVPRGLLEAVAFTNTRFTNLTHTSADSACTGMPKAYGVMGLYLDPTHYFTNTLQLIANKSTYSVDQLSNEPLSNIMGYAWVAYRKSYPAIKHLHTPEEYKNILIELSGLPTNTPGQVYAVNSWLYEVYNFLNTPEKAAFYGFPVWDIDMVGLFGENNLKVLSSSHVIVSEGSVITKSGILFNPNEQPLSADYGPAIWNAAASCNYSGRGGTAVSAVTIHTVQGTYAGCISWFQNCSAQVSAHYVVRSSDGQITQMVLESNKAWHVGSENPYTIGIEHEGYVEDATWYTNAMYASSADLCRDICNSGYGISALRTYYGPSCTGSSAECQLGGCIKIKGHQHFANQTHNDPGPNWNWYTFYNLINNGTPVTTVTNTTGTLYDSGGPSGNYQNDEQTLTLINPANTSSITLSFTQFDLENTWDYLYIYDGSTINAPLLATYTGSTLPASVTSTGGAMLIRFRSDCATTATGWVSNYTSVPNGDFIRPTTAIAPLSNWYDSDITATYTDADNNGGSGLQQRFYTVACYDSTRWNANSHNGFYRDDFESVDPAKWTVHTGTWNSVNGSLVQSDEALANTNIYSTINEGLSNEYIYHWTGKIDGTGTNRRAGFHFFGDSDTLANHGNSYFVWFRADQDEVQVYKVANNVFTLTGSFLTPINTNQWYDFKVSYNRITGKLSVWMDNGFIGAWTDPQPYATGKYIAFRSGNCVCAVDDFEVYRSRTTNTTISIAQADTTADIWRENPPQTYTAGVVRSIVTDNAGNISLMDAQPVNVVFNVYWTGATNIDWNNPLNWAPPKVPNGYIDAYIPDVSQQSANFPLLSTGNNATCRNLTIFSGASITNANQKTITVLKTLTNKGTINAGAAIRTGQ